MIDSKTGKRIIVQEDKKYGAYIRVSNWADCDYIEDVLSEDFYILFEYRRPKELEEDGGQEFLFGIVCDNKKLQQIIDSITIPHK